MPDFSSSGIYGLPSLTASTLQDGDPRVLGWLQEAVTEGDMLNRDDPAFDRCEQGMRYIIGEQKIAENPTLTYVPTAVINKSRKGVQAHVSALTDIKPVFGFKSQNPQFEFHADLLNKLTIAWWLETMADVTLGECIKYALAGGTADLCIEWDPGAGYGMGNHQIIAKDFRDTLPIRPSSNPSPQLWQGVMFRESHSINTLRQKYRDKEQLFRPAPDNLLTTVLSRFRRTVSRIMTPQADTLSGLAGVPQTRPVRPGDVVLFRCYLNDQSRNLTSSPIVMGDPTANYGYVVDPGGLMYPQKRLIVATPELVLYDGPNPYWHGMYPFSRLKLWSVPWCFLGIGLLHDTIPLQDGINDTMKDLRLGIKQWIQPDTVYDKTATSRAFQHALDPAKPGKKIAINPMGAGGTLREPYKKLDGPNPQVLSLLLETFQKLETLHDDLTGVANLQQLMTLRQLPGADTIQKYYEAMTPELRAEGRAMEAFLRDVAQMFKFNLFQFETSFRRINILGSAGLALEDFDFDPDTLVPSMSPTQVQQDQGTGIPISVPNPNYMPSLDAGRPRAERAKAFARLFTFTVAPNSILAMNAQEKKMMNFQLARMGYLDFWSLHESLETPNVGTPPPIPLPPLQPPNPQEVMADITAQLTGMPGGGKYTMGPTGQVLEIRPPMTITERLQAQQLLGIGMTENSAGRKATGEEPPKQQQQSDGSGGERTVTRESKQ